MSEPKLHLLFLPKWYPNRIDPFDGNFVENHAHAISKYANVTVLFVHSDEKASKTYEIEQKNNGVLNEVRCYFKKPKCSIGWINKLLTAFRYIKAQQLAYNYIKNKKVSKFDLLHIHVLSRTAIFALWLKNQLKIPLGITEHWSGYLPESNQYKGKLKKWITKKAVKSASFVSCVSPYLRDSMINHDLQNNYKIVPNVVDCELFQPIDRLPTSKIQILFVGNLLQSPKRILDIINVFAKISQRRKDFILSIYGEGKDEAACKELIFQHKLGDIVKLKGTRSRAEIAQIMAKSDFLFLYSEFENQPCVINEAQACGIPVVVPDIPGILAFMEDELGIVFPRLNQAAFEEAILQMMDNYNRYNSKNIRNSALENFSEEVIGQQFVSLYKAALNDK